ncbi:hypothetical protein T10_7623 [Trichinella papuae]|uniref:Uncharacterized protein n=1 Tax=Trichinella papuae TaxID=268474 RepID=A0A0V1M7L0_9BILA|nr:hypothetical protein T10_7623 [Trichinella papuae]
MANVKNHLRSTLAMHIGYRIQWIAGTVKARVNATCKGPVTPLAKFNCPTYSWIEQSNSNSNFYCCYLAIVLYLIRAFFCENEYVNMTASFGRYLYLVVPSTVDIWLLLGC